MPPSLAVAHSSFFCLKRRLIDARMSRRLTPLNCSQIVAEQILSVREKCVKYYAELSGQPKEKVAMDLDRDKFMSAQEAYEYGLIDKVIRST